MSKLTKDDGPKNAPVSLQFGTQPIHSLKDLREHFQPEALMTAYIKGDLLLWLRQHYYEREADGLAKLKLDGAECLSMLCSTLGIPYQKSLSEDRQLELAAKKEALRKYTDDEEIISHAHLTAFNQEELAALLDRKEKKIYLCREEFSLPISIPDTEYIGFADATISNPYTAEQYRKAGIKISGMELPKEANPDTESLAKAAAKANGYDDFAENHSSFATVFHEKLAGIGTVRKSYHITYDVPLSYKDFTFKHDCKKALEKEIERAYHKAEKYVTIGNSSSISKEMAQFYSKHIQTQLTPHLDMLQKISSLNGTSSTYRELSDLVSRSYKALLEIFEQELTDSSDYYSLYQMQYFLDQLDIEKEEISFAENCLDRIMERLFTDSVQYHATNLNAIMREIEKDLNDHCATFFKIAYKEYQNYLLQIESALETIGAKLPARNGEEAISDYLTRSCVKLAI